MWSRIILMDDVTGRAPGTRTVSANAIQTSHSLSCNLYCVLQVIKPLYFNLYFIINIHWVVICIVLCSLSFARTHSTYKPQCLTCRVSQPRGRYTTFHLVSGPLNFSGSWSFSFFLPSFSQLFISFHLPHILPHSHILHFFYIYIHSFNNTFYQHV